MSYILDALKKSESDRRQASSPPSIYSPTPPPLEPEKHPGKPRLFLWCALSLFIVLLFAAGYYFYGNKVISITITVPEEKTTSQSSNLTAIAEPEPLVEKNIVSEPAASVTAVSEPPASEPDIFEPDVLQPDVLEPDVLEPVVSEPVFKEENKKKRIADTAPALQPQKQLQEDIAPQPTSKEKISKPYVPLLSELDTAYQNMVPDLKLAGHVYSEDASLRMILINDRIVRENGAAAKGFILEEITQDGIILRNGAIRFRIDLP